MFIPFFLLNENLALIPPHHMTKRFPCFIDWLHYFESGIKFKEKALKSSLVSNLAGRYQLLSYKIFVSYFSTDKAPAVSQENKPFLH